MTERVRSASTTSAYYRCPKMENDLSPRKTMLVLVIVVGCFAVLWPKVFYPMLVGSANQHMKPSPIDKTTGCCDVISETDVNTIKIMSELCGTIIKSSEEDKPLSGKEIVRRCRQEVLETCGIDISAVLQEQVRLGQSVKQILDEIRSLNGSLCLKYNYGVAPWRLGVPHRITVKTAPDGPYLRQERPHHLRSELVHPAFRERGRAIPQPQAAPPSRPPPRVVEGRPGPIPSMRPTIGGAGHVVPPSKQGTSSMSVIMPIYTIGIVIFFTYTLMRILFKKQPEGVGGSLYPPVEPDPHFRKEVFESEASRLGPRYSRDISSKLVVNAMSALLDEVDHELEARRKSNEVASQDLVNGTLSNGDVVKPQETEEQPTVKVLGMEMTASCEGGKKWSRPDSPVLPTTPHPPAEPVPPPQEIFLEGALPPQSHLLVAESATEPQPVSGEDPAVVLSGKMTLSVVSLDSENGAEEASTKPSEEPVIEKSTDIAVSEEPVQKRETFDFPEETTEEPDFEIEEYEIHPLIVEKFDAPPLSKIQVEDLEKQNQEYSQSAIISEPVIESKMQTPLIHLDSEEASNTVEVEEVEKEVEELIQEAVQCIEQRQPIVEIMKRLQLDTNEISDSLQKQDEPTLQVLSQTAEQEPELQSENRIADNEQVLKGDSVEKSEEGQVLLRSTEEESLRQIEEQLKQAAEEVAEVPSKAIDISIEEKVLKEKIEAVPVFTKSETEVAPQKNSEEISKPNVELEIGARIETSESKKPETQEEILEPVFEKIEKTQVNLQEAVPSDKSTESVEKTAENEQVEKVDIVEKTEDKPKLVTEEKPEETVKPTIETKAEKKEEPKSEQLEEVLTDEEELGSDEELVEEIEEIVYEEETEEEEDEEEGSEEEIERITNRTDSASAQRVNGERSEDVVEESKYTTVSGNTAAENDISDEELTDNEEVEDEEEIIEVEEEIEDDEYDVEEGNDVNHVSGESDQEL